MGLRPLYFTYMKKILLLLLVIPTLSYGQIKISNLTEATGINSTDLFLLTQGAASKKLKFSTLQYKLFNIIPYAIRLNYSSDSLRIDFKGDSVKFESSQSNYTFDGPIYSDGKKLITTADTINKWLPRSEYVRYEGSKTIIVRNDSIMADTTGQGYSLITNTQLTTELAGLEPPAGGYANNLYFDTLTSIVVPAYKTLTYTPSLNTYNQAMTVNSSEGDKLIATFIYPTGVGETLYPSGLWSFNFYGSVSSASGVSQIGIQYFKRSITNVETNLFITWSSDIENITNDWIKFNTTQPTFTVAETDKMGARLYVRTTSVTNRTITVTIGDGYGSYIGNPNRLRHSQLRALNGDTSFLHVTDTEKNTWNNKLSASGTAANSNLIQGKDTSWIKAQGGGSTIYANSGLYKDGDTIKSKYRILKEFYADAYTSGTGEEDLFSYTVPSNTLAINGDKIIFYFIAQTIDSSPVLKLYFAGTSQDMTLLSSTLESYVVTIIRISSTSCKIMCSGVSDVGSVSIHYQLNSKDWTTTNILKLTGQVSNAGYPITTNMGYIEFKPAAQ